eukprot:TRINITY_DN20842_c0_g2_i1.p1 TRINITY_DN20842_c0_g2~~TRINITY_DN20842_c0_g2_i1.p1  ORF type:complete len:186 (+),score=107.75 TRINITY_DN20842_c0_g2_i1:84-641(+)
MLRSAAAAALRRPAASAVRLSAGRRHAAMPADAFKDESDPKYKEFKAMCMIENLYEFGVKNVAQYNAELRNLAPLKVNDKIKSVYDVMKSKLIQPDSTTIEIVMQSAEPKDYRRAIMIFDDVLTFQLDPTAATYKTMGSVLKAAGKSKAAALCDAMAKDEDRYGSDRMIELNAELHAIAQAEAQK